MSTAELLELVREGHGTARDQLIVRYLPVLTRWAHGRLPHDARGVLDTDDLVQVTVIRALEHVESFEPQREGAFLAYLRQILLNQVRDEIRKVRRRPQRAPLDGLAVPDPQPLPVENMIGTETQERYEHALSQLSEEHREAIILRIELGFSYEAMAKALQRPSANAARLLVARALVRLAGKMRERG